VRTLTGYDEANEARKRVSFKTDLEMWHKFVGYAGWLLMVAKGEEQHLYSQCIHYSYDEDAFEEYCGCPKIKRTKDFKADDECWKCKFYKSTPTSIARKRTKVPKEAA